MKVSILIPVYNESPRLPEVLERVRRAPLPPGCSREIIVVDDGSTDGTADILENYDLAGDVLVHYSPRNSGKGTAIRIGIGLASGDIILIQDGDLEYDPKDYGRLLEPMLSGEADIVYGSRFLTSAGSWSRPPGMAWKNMLANAILTIAANWIYGARITDEATAYKAFRTPLLRDLNLECVRFEFCPEVTAKLRRLGYRIHEVAIGYNGRGISEGKKIRARDGVHALWTLMRYRFFSRNKYLR